MKALREGTLGLLFFLRLRENRWNPELKRQLGDFAPGGVLLAEPLPSSAASTSEFLFGIARSLPRLPFLAVRQEGGAHDPLSRFLPPMPSAGAAAGSGLAQVERFGALTGEALTVLGFNTIFAPLLDLATPFTAKTLGPRTFDSDPLRVAECGGAFLRGLERHKVLACGKHFPGWGSVGTKNSRGLSVSGKPMAALWREDLVPFRELLPRLPMVLISPAAYKAYDFDQPCPASLSAKVVTGLLRVKLGYRGLALAYELESAHGRLEIGQAVVQALNAGCDLLLVDEGGAFESAQRGLKIGLESGKISPERMAQALERIRAAKRRLAPPSSAFPASAWKKLVRRYERFSMEFPREVSRDA